MRVSIHVLEDDVKEMINAAHKAGFDAIGATVIFTDRDPQGRETLADIWEQNWTLDLV